MLVVIKDVVFPVMCFSDADASMWEDDPYDFIRVKYGETAGRACSVAHRVNCLMYGVIRTGIQPTGRAYRWLSGSGLLHMGYLIDTYTAFLHGLFHDKS